jgi:hypothetical protein
MRISDMSIPLIWQALTEPLLLGPIGHPPAPLYLRAQPTANRVRKPKKPRPYYTTWERYAAEIQRRMHPPVPQHLAADFRYARIQEIKHGHFDPLYWIAIPAESVEYLTTNPENIPDPCPMAYGYAFPDNQPSLTTYGDGNVTNGPPYYHGHINGFFFEDTILTWGRAHFKLPSVIKGEQYEPLVVSISGVLHVDSDKRPSRPMYSMLAKVYLGAPLEQFLNPVEPPVKKAISWYQMYKKRDTSAPFHHAVTISHRIAGVETRAKVATPGSKSRATVTYCPRPMFGHGNNNNDDVTTSLTADNCTLFMLKPKSGPHQPISFTNTGDIKTLDLTTGNWTLQTTVEPIVELRVNQKKILVVCEGSTAHIIDDGWQEISTFLVDDIFLVRGFNLLNTDTGWDITTAFESGALQLYTCHINFDGAVSTVTSMDAGIPEFNGRQSARHRTPQGDLWHGMPGIPHAWWHPDFTQAGFSEDGGVPVQYVASDDAIYWQRENNHIYRMEYPDTIPDGAFNVVGTITDTGVVAPTTAPTMYPAKSGFIMVRNGFPTFTYNIDGSTGLDQTTTETLPSTGQALGLDLDL